MHATIAINQSFPPNWQTCSLATRCNNIYFSMLCTQDNVPAVVDALGLPAKHAASFPKRTETVRNNKTGKKEGHMNHSEEVRDDLRKMYAGVTRKITEMPGIMIV